METSHNPQQPQSSPQPSRIAAWKFSPDFLSQLIDGEELDTDYKDHFFGVASKDTQLSFIPQEFIDACIDIDSILTELHAVIVKIDDDKTTMKSADFFRGEALKWNIQQKLLIQLYRGKDGNTIKELSTFRSQTSIDQKHRMEKEGRWFNRKSGSQGEN